MFTTLGATAASPPTCSQESQPLSYVTPEWRAGFAGPHRDRTVGAPGGGRGEGPPSPR